MNKPLRQYDPKATAELKELINDCNWWPRDVYNGKTLKIRKLLNRRADPNASPLFVRVASCNWPSMVQLLLDAGADPNKKDGDGRAALVEAARHSGLEVVKMLLAAGADPNAQSVYGDRALIGAVYGVHSCTYEMIDALLIAGAQPNLPGYQGYSALMSAIEPRIGENKRKKIVQRLLENNADTDFKETAWGMTALMRSVNYGGYAITKMILAAGADPSIKDNSGMNALLIAIRNDDHEHVLLLLDAGADRTVGLAEGKMAKDYACKRGHAKIAGLLSRPAKIA